MSEHDLLPIDVDMVCEKHPHLAWPHDDCPGPGMPPQVKHDLPPIDVDESVRRFVAFERKLVALRKEQLDVQDQIDRLKKRSVELGRARWFVEMDVDMQKTTLEMLLDQEAGHPTVE